jgi:DNA-binding LacI/PurR family transcriptional regulator
MAKRVFHELLRRVENDLRRNYPPGERYRTVRRIAARFHVSLQTAQRLVSHLSDAGVLYSKPRQGLYVTRHPSRGALAGKCVLVVSNHPDPRFNQAYMKGMQTVARERNVSLSLRVNTRDNTESLQFGERLYDWVREENAAGVVAVYFRRAELALYHLLMQGIEVVSDVDMKNLPTLAAVQPNNAHYARLAARALHTAKRSDILLAGFWSPGNRRDEAFRAEMKRLNSSAHVRHVHLTQPESTAHLHTFFSAFTKTHAVFSLDYAANFVVAPYFVEHRIPTKKRFLVFDADESIFTYPGIAPVRAIGPSLHTMGRLLLTKLLTKLETGHWPGKRLEMI